MENLRLAEYSTSPADTAVVEVVDVNNRFRSNIPLDTQNKVLLLKVYPEVMSN